MKLNVQGIEEIEITDPSGLCNPVPQPPGQPIPQLPSGRPNPGLPGMPFPSQPNPFQPQPMVPAPFGDPSIKPIVPSSPTPWTKAVYDPTKWGIGGEAIRRAGEQVDPEKFEKNWQASKGGEHTDGEGNSPQSSR